MGSVNSLSYCISMIKHTSNLAFLLLVAIFLGGLKSEAWAQPAKEPTTESPPVSKEEAKSLNLSIPKDATVQVLADIVQKAKKIRPENNEQYIAMQTTIRKASKLMMEKLKGKEESAQYKMAELETISASILLMTFANEDSKQKTLEQVHKFLREREELTLSDVQTGMLAAAMLELQPNKKPAHDTYVLMDELLKDDKREEMQNLRVNLRANVRRLELLGSKFVLKSKTTDNQAFDIEQFQGKFVIVDFFATWCGSCLEEIPRLKTQLEKYQSKGLEVVGISLDEDRKALDKFLDEALLPWPVLHDAEKDPMKRLQVQFGISQLPTVLLLNKEGVVVSLEARGSELERLMQMLFEAPTLAPAPDKVGEKNAEEKEPAGDANQDASEG